MSGTVTPLARAFALAREQERTAFIPYIMAGDPDIDTSERVIHALAKCGADAIELGIPYGDPLADGPTIAAAGGRALSAGVGMRDVFALVGRLHAAGAPPIVLFTYFNPVYQYGIERFSHDASDAGAVATIIPDIPLEESGDVSATLAEHALEMPLLVAPTTPPDRARIIAEHAGGFVYVVSRLGVTGVGTTMNVDPIRDQVRMLRSVTTKPLAVGFGISRPDHAAAVAPLADGIIVGSAMIESYLGSFGDAAAAQAAAFARSLIAASVHKPAGHRLLS